MAPTMTRHSVHSALAWPLGKRSTTAHVDLGVCPGFKGWERHEEDKDDSTCERERHMELKQTMTPVAAGTTQ